jgi:hypothetical protein
MYCALCLLSASEPRIAIADLLGSSMCDLHVRETGKRMAASWSHGGGAAEAVDGTVRATVLRAVLDGTDVDQ